jgi:hypothetical protein
MTIAIIAYLSQLRCSVWPNSLLTPVMR